MSTNCRKIGRNFPLRGLLLSILAFFSIIGICLLQHLLSTQSAPISFANKELDGNTYQRSLEKILYGLSWQHIITQRNFRGKPMDSSHLVEIQKKMDGAFSELKKHYAKFGENLKLTEKDLAQRGRAHYEPNTLQQEWLDLSKRLNSINSAESSELHTHLISDVRTMMIHMGDTSNLILDPDLDSYYLMDITLIDLPQIQERIQRTLVEMEKLISQKSLSPNDQKKAYATALIMDTSGLDRDICTIIIEDKNFYGKSDSLEPNLTSAHRKFITNYLQMRDLVRGVANGKLPDIKEFSKVAENALQESFNYWEVAVGELDKLLEKRIDHHRHLKYKFSVFSYSILTIAIIIAFLIIQCLAVRFDNLMNDLFQQAEAAEAANSAKSKFLTNMSHEIRTPLSAIVGFSELIQTQSLSEQKLTDFVGKIRRNSEHLLKVVNEILDLAKIDAGKMTLQKSNFSLEGMLNDLISANESLLNSKKMNLCFTIEDSVPKQIFSDQTKLYQILLNLVSNSIKFSQNGQITITVSAKPPQHLVFFIKDEGRGMSAEEAEKVFQPFVQVGATDKNQRGTGLGLVLSRKFAQVLGGDLVLLQTELGKGTTFMLTILAPVTPQGFSDEAVKLVK